MFEKDSDQFPIKCSGCLNEFSEDLGSVKTRLWSRCPECGLRITHDAHQLDRVLQNDAQVRVNYLRQFLRLKMDE